MRDGGALFITWNDSRRSNSLARALQLQRVVLVADRSGVRRHLEGALRTARLLLQRRPGLVWYQFSFVLGVLLAGYRLLPGARDTRLVADLHTKALRRSGPRWLAPVVLPLKRWALRSAGACLVANQENAEYACSVLGVHAHVLSDPLPVPPAAREGVRSRGAEVLVVSSFACDEPIALLAEVARGSGLKLSLTGDPSALSAAGSAALVPVVTLTGWLSDEEFWDRLRHAGAVVVLSTERACLPCGAYEAVAVGQRPIVRDDPELRAVFGESARYVNLDCGELTAAIRAELEAATKGHDALPCADTLRERWEQRWEAVRADLSGRRLVPEEAEVALLGEPMAGV